MVFLQRDPSETRYTKYKPVIPLYERYHPGQYECEKYLDLRFFFNGDTGGRPRV